MPYIDKYKRDSLVDLIRMYYQYPHWKNPEESDEIFEMIDTWLRIITKKDPLKLDGYVNFMCTFAIKHTHRTYCLKAEKKVYNSFDKEVAHFVREMLTMAFELQNKSYIKYERLYGLLSLMEVEFERRGWGLDRPDIKRFFLSEKKYWRNQIAAYEDEKIKANGDVE